MREYEMQKCEIQKYKMFELEFQGEKPGNAALAAPEAEFSVNGVKTLVKGFYAGDGIYKIRFYPKEEGTVVWKVNPEVKDGGRKIRLSGRLEGSEVCEAAKKQAVRRSEAESTLDMPLDSHGMVRAKGLHFVYEDGTRYQAFGTTVYALIHQTKELVDTSFATLSKSPFTKVRFCVFPKDYAYNHNEPEYFAFEETDGKFDVNRPCYAYWNELERRIRQLDSLGIQGDLILFHPYDRWGFSKFTYEECITYLSYLVRRLSAFPNIWWSLANEYDLMEHFKREWWDGFAQFIGGNDPYGHLLSNHNCLPYWNFSNPYTTHCCIQDTNVNQTAALQKKYGKPVVFDEVCYEGNIEFPWGNISAFEMTHRFWTAHLLGAYCTHGETYLDEKEILWWAKGGVLKGESPERIAFLRRIMEELPDNPEVIPGYWDSMSPEQLAGLPEEEKNSSVWVRGMCALPVERLYRMIDKEIVVRSHCGEDVYLQYYGKQCCGRGVLELPPENRYDIEIIDIWEMTRRTVKRGVSGKTEFALPGKEGIAAIAWKKA